MRASDKPPALLARDSPYEQYEQYRQTLRDHPFVLFKLLRGPGTCFSYHHQIPRNPNISLEMLCGRVAPSLVLDSIDAGHQVREDEGFNPGFLCDATDIFNRRMVGPHVRYVSVEVGRHALGDPIADIGFHRGHVHGLMDEDIGTLG